MKRGDVRVSQKREGKMYGAGNTQEERPIGNISRGNVLYPLNFHFSTLNGCPFMKSKKQSDVASILF